MQSQGKDVGVGEYLLLSDAPMFKRRYAVDGDIILGCSIGCNFCYYRMIDSTAPYIGTGKFKRLASPEEFAGAVANSRLIFGSSLVILGARGDASMYPDEIPQMLEAARVRGSGTKFLALRRAVFDGAVKEHLELYDELYYGTTVTPDAGRTGTPVQEQAQLEGLRRVADHASRISVEVGPITVRNIGAVKRILISLKELGWAGAIYRGVSAGSYGISREEIVSRLRDAGFLTEEQAREALASPEYFYGIKNWVDVVVEQVVRNLFDEVGLKPYRYSGQFYAERWGIPVALTRRNRLRSDLIQFVKDVEYPGLSLSDQLTYLGYEKFEIQWSQESGARVAYVSTDLPITEDIAMYLGEVTGVGVIASNYLPSPDLRVLKHYLQYDFFGMPDKTKELLYAKVKA